MSMSTSDTQVLGSPYDLHKYLAKCGKLVVKYDIDNLGQINGFDDFFEHFGECYNLIAQHNLFQLSQFDNVLYILQYLAQHFNFLNFIFGNLQLTFILQVFERIFIFLRGINILSLIYEQLNQQLAFQLKLFKKLHVITHKQFDDKSKPYPDI
ncbi:hypothetical protein KC318_g1493 [Hortaea werneckii]|nr:hypothetical protein KC334_g1410 [Hortaea werneckii]KAI7674596.1 hypothetical protein KC318_g1493 [Hortaea werneckii]